MGRTCFETKEKIMVNPRYRPFNGNSRKPIKKQAEVILSETKKDLETSGESIDKVLTETNKLIQKVKGEKITKSGFSKGKDIKK